LYKDIPLTADMAMEIIDFTGDELHVFAPLDKNINDKGSVFGGSSSALMIISAWSLIKLACDVKDIEADIVIHKNQTHWNKALYQDLNIHARFVEEYNFDKIKDKINTGKHQRIDCEIKLVNAAGVLFSTMVAKYVIIAQKKV
jgi:thioesterase domain-containing protein